MSINYYEERRAYNRIFCTLTILFITGLGLSIYGLTIFKQCKIPKCEYDYGKYMCCDPVFNNNCWYMGDVSTCEKLDSSNKTNTCKCEYTRGTQTTYRGFSTDRVEEGYRVHAYVGTVLFSIFLYISLILLYISCNYSKQEEEEIKDSNSLEYTKTVIPYN
jgi:hypothetical protein